MTGVLFRQLGWMVTIMMIISTTCALSLTPMLCSQWLRLNNKHSRLYTIFFTPIEKALDSFDNGYARLLNVVVAHRTVTIVICLATFVGSIFLMKQVGTEFFPTAGDGRLGVEPGDTHRHKSGDLTGGCATSRLTLAQEISGDSRVEPTLSVRQVPTIRLPLSPTTVLTSSR